MSTGGSNVPWANVLVRVFLQLATFNEGAEISMDGSKAAIGWIIVDGFELSTIGEQTVHSFHIVVFGDQDYTFSFIWFQNSSGV